MLSHHLVTKDFGFATGALAVIGANTSDYVDPAPAAKDLGKNTPLPTVSKTFQAASGVGVVSASRPSGAGTACQ